MKTNTAYLKENMASITALQRRIDSDVRQRRISVCFAAVTAVVILADTSFFLQLFCVALFLASIVAAAHLTGEILDLRDEQDSLLEDVEKAHEAIAL